MKNIETLDKYEVNIKGSNGVGYQNVLIPKGEVEKLINLMEGRHKRELEEKDKEIQVLRDRKDEAAKELGDLQNTLQQERKENAKNQETFENEKKNLKAALKELEEELKTSQEEEVKLKEEKEQIRQDMNSKIEEIKAKNSALEEDLKKSKDDLNKLEKDCKLDLYKMYKEISPNSENYGIKSDDFYIFIATSARVEVLEKILEAIKINASNGKEISKEREFFDKLFESIKEYYSLERLHTQIGDTEYDDKKHLKIEGDTRGKVSEVVVDGFVKGARTYHSIVKVLKKNNWEI